MTRQSTALAKGYDLNALTGLLSVLVAVLGRGAARAFGMAKDHWRLNVARRDSHRLSDRTLADLGMNRPMVAAMAAGSPPGEVRIARRSSMA